MPASDPMLILEYSYVVTENVPSPSAPGSPRMVSSSETSSPCIGPGLSQIMLYENFSLLREDHQCTELTFSVKGQIVEAFAFVPAFNAGNRFE